MGNSITLDKWMMQMWLPPVPGAEKYKMCQKLTATQAKEIIQMIAQSTEFDLASRQERCWSLYRGHPYREFISGCLTLLLASDRKDANKWTDTLWHALEEFDRVAIRGYAKQLFNVDIRCLVSDR